jgi:hypothetical protein
MLCEIDNIMQNILHIHIEYEANDCAHDCVGVAQIKAGYIKGDQIKHILPEFFFTHELLGSYIDVIQVKSSDNLADLFTKLSPIAKHKHIVRGIGM